MSIVDNCGEILLDLSLEKIINQFVQELAVIIDFEKQMSKHSILNILRLFCIYKEQGITETQNLLYSILFETEKGMKIFLPFTFNKNQLILRLENDNEIPCSMLKNEKK